MSDNGLEEEFEGFEDVSEEELYTVLDDERRTELDELVALKVLGLELWEESLGDEDEAPVKPEERVFFDCDLYLEGNLALELYAAAAYPDPDGDPVAGMDAIFDVVGRLSDDAMTLVDYGDADDEGGLALAFGRDEKVELVLACSAWMVSDWEADDEDDEDDEDEEQEAV